MHIKSSHAEDNADQRITGSTRQHIISRLHKAIGHAQKLVELLQDRQTTKATENDYLEARAYAQCLAGAEEFEKQSSQRKEDPAVAWRKCVVHFSEAHVIYSALLYATQKDQFKEVIGGTVDPSIRYAAYQSRLPRTTAVATTAKEHFPREESELVSMVEKLNPTAFNDEAATAARTQDGTNSTVSIPTTISWRGRNAPIADAAIGQAMAATTIATTQLSDFIAKSKDISAQALAAQFDPVLTSAQDTVDAVRRSISDLTKEGVTESDARMQDLRVSDLAANYALISWRIGRNRVLISSPGTQDDGLELGQEQRRPVKKAKKGPSDQAVEPESKVRRIIRLTERVVLYDATLQSIDSVKDLRGAARDSDFMAELDGQRAYFQALKCINIGYSHAALSAHKEALVLFARAQTFAQTVSESLSGSTVAKSEEKPSSLEVTTDQVSRLSEHLELLILRQRGLVALKQHMNDEKSTGVKPLPISERLHEYPASGQVDLDNIVTWPPKMQPVPVKPIFLDLAWNYIEYPGRSQADDEEINGQGEGTEGIVSGVVETAKQATEAIKEAVVPAAEETGTPKKRGWFGFGR